MGDKVYSILGFSRTNLQDYYNLSFEPMDSISLGIGTKFFKQTNLYYYSIKDNRLNTAQTVNHVVWQFSPEEGERWLIDWANKKGKESVTNSEVIPKVINA